MSLLEIKNTQLPGERFQLAVEIMSDGLVVQNSLGAIIDFNPAALSILGLSEDQLLGRTSMDPKWQLVHEDGSQIPGEDHPAMVALRTGKKIVGQVMGIHLPASGLRWVRISATPFFQKSLAENGIIEVEQFVVCVLSDVTEAVNSKNQAEQHFVHSLDLIGLGDLQGRFIKANPSLGRILGYTEVEVKGHSILEFVHPDDLEKSTAELQKIAQGIDLLNFECRCRCKNGKYKVLSWVARPNLATSTIYATARDVTEQRMAEDGFRQVISALNETAIVAFTDDRGFITQVNEQFCKISGYSKQELIGKSHRLVNSKAHPKEFFKQMWESISAGKNWTGEIENKNKSGQSYWVRTVICPIFDAEQKIAQYMAIRFDITDEKRNEIEKDNLRFGLQQAVDDSRRNFENLRITKNKLLESESQLKAVLQNVPSMIFVKDYHKTLSFSLMNKFGLDLLGLTEEQILGKNDFDFFPKEQAEFFVQNDREVFASRAVMKIDREEIQTPHGKRFLRTYKVPTFDAQGNPQLLIGISNDITEDIKNIEALEQERLKSIHSAKLASLGEMSSGVAHEINNPLTIIIGVISKLEKYKSDSVKFSAKVDTLQRAADRIVKIVSGLKKFSRTTHHSMLQEISLGCILQEALVLTEAKAKKHSVLVSIDIQTDAQIRCDEVEIEQVVVNLVTNAIDAVKDLSEKWVNGRVFESGEEVVMQIRDSGQGISEAIEGKLFQPFFTTKPIGEGTGLGLSIAKGILDEHRANIFVNRADANTCFEVRFPRISKAQIAA